MSPGPKSKALVDSVTKRRELHEQYERDGNRSFWQSVGTMGTVGWSIALPMAGGTLFGRWLDGRLESGQVFMFFFMLVGLGMGCTVVWQMISEKR